LAPNPAYLDGLKLLARRELSEKQVRQRLARKGHAADLIDEAVERLREERAIDDTRVAEAIARTATSVKRRGRQRVRIDIERSGIAAGIAKRAVDEVFAGIDDGALLEQAIRKRLRGREIIDTERELHRLYRYLVAQGFEPERALAALRALYRPRPS
jgi:regulatory protein